MSLRIFATGDNHFDSRSDRYAHTIDVHRTIASLVERERPDAFLLGGDMFERESTPDERLHAREFVRAVCRWCPAVAIRGNHDAPGDISSLLGKLRTDHPLHVVEDARVVSPLAGLQVAAVAWPTRASTIDDGAAREALRDVLRGLGAAMASDLGARRILLGHFDVSGATSGAGQPLIGGSLTVSVADLLLAQPQAVVMSHIHKAQEFAAGDVPVVYCGSPVAHDFGEVEMKSILDLAWNGHDDGFCVGRIPTGARRMLHITARHDVDSGRLVDFVFHGVDGDLSFGSVGELDLGLIGRPMPALQGNDVRLRYVVRSEHRAAARALAAQIEAQWLVEGAHAVKVEDEVLASVRSRSGAEEVGRAPTLADQMRALWKARGDEPPPERAASMLSKLSEIAP